MPEPAAVRPLFLSPAEGERVGVVGSTVRVLADASVTGGRCFIFEEHTPPGVGPPLHRHGVDDEFFFILEGRYRFVLDGREFLAEPGAFVSAPKGSVDTFVNCGASPGRMLLVTMPAGLEGPFRETQALEKLGPPTPEALAAVFAKFGLGILGPPLRP
jgi:mannose-6-phosphate isomerase-like protein (cupin superfamily)